MYHLMISGIWLIGKTQLALFKALQITSDIYVLCN